LPPEGRGEEEKKEEEAKARRKIDGVKRPGEQHAVSGGRRANARKMEKMESTWKRVAAIESDISLGTSMRKREKEREREREREREGEGEKIK